MNIARPAGGFHIQEKPEIEACLKKHEAAWPRLRPLWSDLKNRLKMTAHREGAVVTELGGRVFQTRGVVETKTPAILVVYHVLGETLTFMNMKVIDPATLPSATE